MFGESEGIVRLLDAEPSLARGIKRQTIDEARESLTAEVRQVKAGLWEESWSKPADPLFLGYLILEGTFTREISVASRPSVDLLGPGDLIRPWVIPEALDAMHVSEEWSLLSVGRVAVLDEELHTRAQAFPSILTVLLDRVTTRASWLELQIALCQLPRIDHRLLLTFRYLAERWGQGGSRQVKIPIRLSHRNLAAMIGARRPRVTAELGTLAERKVVERHEDGTWTFFMADVDPMAILSELDDPPAESGTVIGF